MAEENPGSNGTASGGESPAGDSEAPRTRDERQPGGTEENGPPPEEVGPDPETTGGETRRQLLKTGAGLGIVGVVGYAYLRSQEDVLATTDGSTVDDVPERAEFVFSWTGSELQTAEGFEAAVDEELGALTIDGAGNAAELFGTIESATGIDPRETGEVSAFGEVSTESGTYAGLIFESETDPQTVRDRLDERGHLLGTSEYRGRALWSVGNDRLTWDLVLSHLGGNRYALGTNAELEDVIDVRAGDGRRIGGAVIDGLDSTGDGLLRGGFVVPPEAFADLDLSITARLADGIEYGSAAISEDGVLTVTFVAPDSSAAEDLDQTLNALDQLDLSDILAQIDGDSAIVGVMLAILDDLDTAVDGSEVRVTIDDGFRVPAIALATLVDGAVVT
jgi:hypothetical protein